MLAHQGGGGIQSRSGPSAGLGLLRSGRPRGGGTYTSRRICSAQFGGSHGTQIHLAAEGRGLYKPFMDGLVGRLSRI